MRLRIALSAACLFAVPATTFGLMAQAPASSTQTLNVSASLVVVPVTVRDGKNHLIRTLTRDDFALSVDGKPQAIRYFDREDDLPLTVGLLVDVSGSQRTVLDAERTASAAFLDGMLQPNRDRAFVVQFGRTADLLADITPSLPKLQAALQKIDADGERPSFQNGDPQRDDSQDGQGSGSSTQDSSAGRSDNSGGYGGHGRRGGGSRGGGMPGGGGTVLYDAVFLSSDEVLKKAPAKNGQTRKAIILLTDGDDRGSKESVADAIEAAQRTDATLYAIYYKGEESRGGFGNGGGSPGGRGGGFPGGHGGGFPGGGGSGYPGGGGNRERVDGRKILERMADETGGRVYVVTKKMPLAEIYKEIAEELRSQYRIGFSPANNEEGFHKIVIDTAKQSKLILQARSGYYSGAPGR